MIIERHIFGSVNGYTTLARSPGVTADDARVLEQAAYAFGQSNDAHFVKSLSRQPAWFTRVLRGGRRGLTRVTAGNPDDNARPTLRMVTAIVSQRDWDQVLCGSVSRLLDNTAVWTWDSAPTLAPLQWPDSPAAQTVARRSVPRVLALMAEVENSFNAHRAVIVSATEFSQEDVQAVEMLMPPGARAMFTSAYRSLGAQLPVTLNAIADEAGGGQRATFHYSGNGSPTSPYAQYLATTSLSSGAVPMAEIMGYRSFAHAQAMTQGFAEAPPPQSPFPGVPVTVVHRAKLWPLLMTVAICVACLVAMAVIEERRVRGQHASLAQAQGEMEKRQKTISELTAELTQVKGQYHDLQARQPTTKPTTRAKSGSGEAGISTDLSERTVDALTAQVEKLTKERDHLKEDRDQLTRNLAAAKIPTTTQTSAGNTQALTNKPAPKEFTEVKADFNAKLTTQDKTSDVKLLINFVSNKDNQTWLAGIQGKVGAIREDGLSAPADVEWLKKAKAAVGQLQTMVSTVGQIQSHRDTLDSLLGDLRGLTGKQILERCDAADAELRKWDKDVDDLAGKLTGTLDGTRFDIRDLKNALGVELKKATAEGRTKVTNRRDQTDRAMKSGVLKP